MAERNKQAARREAYPYDHVVLISETESSRQVCSTALLGDGEILAIQHRGECYILRQTRAGKLILTK